MRTVVVIEHVQHGQDNETTIIIFEEDIHDPPQKKPILHLRKLDLDLKDSTTMTNMELAPPIKDPSIKDPTYQIIEPRLNDSTTTSNMEPAPPIKDGSIKDPTYHAQIVLGYTVDQQGQNI
jgi:hypothetical protein